jgi:hypothetical protein
VPVRRLSRRLPFWVGTAALVVAAAFALAGDARSGPIAPAVADWVNVESGLMSLRTGRAVRLSVVEVDGTRTSRRAHLTVRDGQGRILREVNELVTPLRPLFLDLGKHEAPPGSDPNALPIRAEFKFPCVDPGDSGLITMVEIYNPSSSAVEASSSCGCPCCGPTVPPGVAFDCGGHRASRLTAGP